MGGKREAFESPRTCAYREFLEETNQEAKNLEFRALFRYWHHQKQETRYRVAYYTELDEQIPFASNDEMSYMLWDFKQELSNSDQVDVIMLKWVVTNSHKDKT